MTIEIGASSSGRIMVKVRSGLRLKPTLKMSSNLSTKELLKLSVVADVRKKLFTADGLKKLIVECCGLKVMKKRGRAGATNYEEDKMRGLRASELL
uniref:Uncharacterized protein n=1 Tax=Salix viminalis TaxID=40686 RepID=A0A6N2NCT8_SALVM